jgi:protein TonB
MSSTLSRSWPLLTSIALHGVMATLLSGVMISIPQQQPLPRKAAPIPIIRWEPRPPNPTPPPMADPLLDEITETVREAAAEPVALEPIADLLPDPHLDDSDDSDDLDDADDIVAPSPVLVAVATVPQDIDPVEAPESVKPLVEISPQVRIELFQPATVEMEWQPIYPRECIRKGQQGEVILSVQVSADGVVLSVEVQQSSGHRLLDRAAVKSVERLRFVPATRDGVPVSSTLELPLLYQLET